MKKISADSDYFLRFYLDSDPFPEEPWSRGPYLSEPLQVRLDQANRLVDTTSAVVVITAPAGGGRSTMARQMQAMPGEGRRSALAVASGDLEIRSLARLLVESADPQAAAGGSNPVSGIHKYLENCHRQGVRPVFIVDDADRLPPACIEFIVQLAALRYNETSFHFVLFGAEGLADLFSRHEIPGIEDLPVEYLHLPAFSLEDTAGYLRHRLAACGWSGELPFTAQDVSFFHGISGGLPRATNYLARQRLLEYARPAPRRQSVAKPVILVPVLAVAGILAYVSMEKLREPGNPPMREHPAVQPAPQIETPPVQPGASGNIVSPTPSASTSVEPGTVAPPPALPEGGTTGEAGTGNVIHPLAAEPAAPQRSGVEPPVEPAAAAVSADVPAREAQVEASTAPAAGATPTALPSSPNILSPDVAPETGEWHNGVRGPDWIREQPQGTYFLQLVNASELSNATALLERLSDVKDKLSGYTNYTPSGHPRYLLLYGAFPDRQTAQSSIAVLPPSVKYIPPWPRSRTSVLRDLDSVTRRGLSP